MKLLHTSDWHLGRSLYGVSRAADHEAVLSEILTIARTEKPDLIVHTGDLFDRSHPANPDLLRGATYLNRLQQVAPVVVVSGNHDSPTVFQTFAVLHSGSRLHMVGNPARPEHGGILTVEAADGVQARVGVLPFVSPSQIVDAFEDPATWRRAYTERVRDISHTIADRLLSGLNPRRQVAIFATHLYVGGAQLTASEHQVRDEYTLDAADIPPVSYAAFGHLHQPQPLPGPVPGRYAGSPIALDFGEEGQHKSVALADLRPGQPTHIEEVRLSAGRPLRRFDGNLEQLGAQAETLRGALCLLTIHLDDHLPDLSERVHRILPDSVILAVHLRFPVGHDNPWAQIPQPDGPAPTMGQLFADYLTERADTTVPAHRLQQTFNALFDADADQPPVFADEHLLTDPLPELPRMEEER